MFLNAQVQDGLSGAGQGIVGAALLSMLALVGWLLKLAHSKTIPDQQLAFSAALEKLSKGNAEAMDKVVNAFVAAAAAGTSANTAITNKLIEVFQQEQKEARATASADSKVEREVCERRHQENLVRFDKHQDELLAALRDSRHAINGLANTQTMLVAVVEQVAGLAPGRVSAVSSAPSKPSTSPPPIKP